MHSEGGGWQAVEHAAFWCLAKGPENIIMGCYAYPTVLLQKCCISPLLARTESSYHFRCNRLHDNIIRWAYLRILGLDRYASADPYAVAHPAGCQHFLLLLAPKREKFSRENELTYRQLRSTREEEAVKMKISFSSHYRSQRRWKRLLNSIPFLSPAVFYLAAQHEQLISKLIRGVARGEALA